MKKSELRKIIKEEIRRTLYETLTKKDFKAMAREIRNAAPQYQEVLTNFAITLAKKQNPRFDEQRFREAIKTGKGI